MKIERFQLNAGKKNIGLGLDEDRRVSGRHPGEGGKPVIKIEGSQKDGWRKDVKLC